MPPARVLRSNREINLMRQAGLLVWCAHQRAAKVLAPGVTTREVDATIHEVFKEAGAEALFLNYPGKTPFPAATCISINDEVVHGIPGDRELVEGDIVSLDTGCRINGWCGDAAVTHAIGEIGEESKKLLDVTSGVLDLSIELIPQKQKWSQVAKEMQTYVEDYGLSVVEQFVGHAIGKEMHEAPQVPNYYDEKRFKNEGDFDLRPGMVLAIEPMVNLGTKHCKVLSDHWTVVTSDGKNSAHFEHTVAITKDGSRRLTAAPEEGEEIDPQIREIIFK